jgi:cytochrome c-type biogenesis protein CcmE
MTDTAERAPLPKNIRVAAVLALLVASGGLAMIIFGGIGENLIFYWGPKEVKAAGDKAYGATVRLGGQVKAGSIVIDEAGTRVAFTVIDDQAEVAVKAEQMPPAMFREGIGVIVEGTMTRAGHFAARRLIVKHDNEYRAPDDPASADAKELMGTAQGLEE